MNKNEAIAGTQVYIKNLEFTNKVWSSLHEMANMIGKVYKIEKVVNDYGVDGKQHDGVIINGWIFDFRDLEKIDKIEKPGQGYLFNPKNIVRS